MDYGLIDKTKTNIERKKKEKKREREVNDLKKILFCAEGRRLFWRVLSHAGLYRSSFTGNSETFFKEGQRSVGLFWLNEMMTAAPNMYAQMMSEHYSEAKSEEIQQQKEETENE